MPKTARKTDYLFHKNNSPNWYIRLQFQGRDQIQSLGTPDKLEAEAKAATLIGEHKAALFAARPRLETVWEPKYTPGLHDSPNGERIAATERELSFYNATGKLLRTEPNGGPLHKLVGGGPLSLRTLAEAYGAKQPAAPPKNADDAIIETYLESGGRKNTGIRGYSRREALAVWALFKRLTENKPLKECTRDDGRKLVTYFQDQGLKSSTIEKKIAWLNSAVHFATNEGRFHTINPFSSIAPRGGTDGNDDAEDRQPISDDDMKIIRRNIGKLNASDQLLIRLLGSTGMRLGEAFEIGATVKMKVRKKVNGKWETRWEDRTNSDETERGIRYVVVGHKTDQSRRRVPFPAAVLPHLPKNITGPLFTSNHKDPVDAASKRLNRFLDDIGIDDPSKVIHSFRHRAKDRLRAAECQRDIQLWLLGHDETTVDADYGAGTSVKVLKKWIEKIGF